MGGIESMTYVAEVITYDIVIAKIEKSHSLIEFIGSDV